jgi:hypothetical protein
MTGLPAQLVVVVFAVNRPSYQDNARARASPIHGTVVRNRDSVRLRIAEVN